MVCQVDRLLTRQLETLDESIDIQAAAAFMTEKELGYVVVSSDKRVIGLFTEKDLVNRVVGLGKAPAEVTLGEVCSRKLISVHADTSCENAVIMMRHNKCRRLLVYQGDKLLGLVTLRQIAQAMADDRGRKNVLPNIVGGVTIVVTLIVILLGISQLPNMVRIAMEAFR